MLNKKKEKGFIAFYLVILVLMTMLSIGISIFIVTRGEQKILQSITKSNQAYFTAEAGIEDALLRLVNIMNWSSSYVLKVGGATSTIEISDILGGSRSITSMGNAENRIRKIRVIHKVSTQDVSFHYGAQIGDGGMEMGNNAQIQGNVFSNGSVISIQKGKIQDTIKVATIGGKIEGLEVGKDAYTHICKNCTIGGVLYYSGGSLENCTVTGSLKEHPVQESKDLPIPQSQIDNWKTEASCSDNPGCIINGDYVLDGKVTGYLGPKKITGNMTLDNKATLIMTGSIWVEGNIFVKNGAGIQLDLNSYGGLSGVLIADGKIDIKPGASLGGSGEEGSYLLLLSTNASLDPLSPAINIDNTTLGGIFYTPNIYDGRNGGVIVIRNNVSTRQVTGYKVYLEENAVVSYEYGLQDAEFSSGPGGSWEVASWKEIE
ncbi:hypothetical protein AMJ50_00715 [Parcubacteria bacterium DG_74_3]|nr:MAG: hypothetical protein AMJ50_00715 [Parcubacteria bacterium DG_74_3]